MTRTKLPFWQVVIGTATGYVGAVVGGAFATGREITHFFVIPQSEAASLLLTAGGFCGVGLVIMMMVFRNKATSSTAVLDVIFENERCSKIFDAMLTAFYWAVLTIVIAAAGALGRQLWGFPRLVGIVLLALGIDFSLQFQRKGVMVVNIGLALAISATLIVVIIQMPGFSIGNNVVIGQDSNVIQSVNKILGSVLYVSYNLLFGLAIFPFWAKRGSASACLLGTIFGGTFLGVLVWAEWKVLSEVLRHVFSAEIPMNIAVNLLAPQFAGWYPVVLVLSLLTTGIALCVALETRLREAGLHHFDMARHLILLSAIPAAFFDLGILVRTFYPLAGVLSMVLWVLLLRRAWHVTSDVG